MITLDSDLIHKAVSEAPKLPRDHTDDQLDHYLKYWETLTDSLEKYLGTGYKVIAFNPDFIVQVTISYPGIDQEVSTRTYTINVPMELVVVIHNKLKSSNN
jgi:hypothetical protein